MLTIAGSSATRALARLVALATVLVAARPACSQPSRVEVSDAMHRAVGFFREHASAGGGYVFQISSDLSKREGEGKVGPTTAWIEPPATPAIGLAYLESYRACGDPLLLEAAKETANALVRGQLHSGGWDNRIEFAATDRKRYAYRVDGGEKGKRLRNTTTFDDDKSQSAIRFLMQIDKELKFHDDVINESVRYALDAALKSQYPNGAWPQRYSELRTNDARDDSPSDSDQVSRNASLPQSWSRQFPGNSYAGFYTLNDNTMSDLVVTMLDAWEIYGDQRYLKAAQRGGEFFLRAQLPEPQPGWSQQYDRDMHPAWARKFEPPAVTGGESQGVMRTLILLYRRTASVDAKAERFLEPIVRAIAYYRRSQLDDGRLARFYELGTNRPLFFTKDYKLTYLPDDMPTHYSFIVTSKLDQIESELRKVKQTPTEQLWTPGSRPRVKRSAKLDSAVDRIVSDLDSRGAWVTPGRLKYHEADDSTRAVITSQTFAKNLRLLATWLAAEQPRETESRR